MGSSKNSIVNYQVPKRGSFHIFFKMLLCLNSLSLSLIIGHNITSLKYNTNIKLAGVGLLQSGLPRVVNRPGVAGPVL